VTENAPAGAADVRVKLPHVACLVEFGVRDPA
jgi:hypothetical protein